MTDVVIVGAGPVGLLLAALLGRQGRSVLVLEQNTTRSPGSNAIGVMPPSLDLLAKLGLSETLALWGAPIQRAVVHGPGQTRLGTVTFDGLAAPHNFILSVPQSATETVLDQHLLSYPTVRVEYGWTYQSLDQDGEAVTAFFQDASGSPRCERSQFLVGCDGVRSAVRTSIDVDRRPKKYSSTFFMGDYADDTGWTNEAHLFFTPRGAVESFPLGQGRRRWIVQTPHYLDSPGTYLEDEVKARTGLQVPAGTCTWQSPFGVQKWISRHYAWGRVYLAGDSAHQMSPIGGQGMNTGFADAEFLAALLGARFDHPEAQSEDWNQVYSTVRRRAARTAAGRAEFSMALGTVRGLGSAVRNLLLSLMIQTMPRALPRNYAMLTIPGKTLAEAKRSHPGVLSSLKEPS